MSQNIVLYNKNTTKHLKTLKHEGLDKPLKYKKSFQSNDSWD